MDERTHPTYSGFKLDRLRESGWNLAITYSTEGTSLENLVVVLRHDQLDLLADRIILKLEARAHGTPPDHGLPGGQAPRPEGAVRDLHLPPG